MWLATLTLPLILAAPPTDAEKLLLDMERQLVEAKSANHFELALSLAAPDGVMGKIALEQIFGPRG